MALIIWDGRYSVGIESLDWDHIVIASLINHLDEVKQHHGDEQTVAAIVRALIRMAYEHFAREELLFVRYDYPELHDHRQEHRLLEEQLEELYAAYQRTPDPEISREIMELLNYWLVGHILKVDKRYAAFLAARVR
ncbi:MAG: bacteriohemerythrin [Rhodospirillales bacterium]|nr:bacteriohemerythrin [Rhodospirillales bacterium]